jgi:type I restriction enzyme S subunit
VKAWPTRRICDIANQGKGEIRTGPFGSQLHRRDYTDAADGVPVIMPVNMVGGRVSREGIAKVSPAKAAEMSAHVTQPGDVLLSRRGDIGRYCLIDTGIAGALCGTGSLRVSIQGSELLPEYLCMFLETPAGLHELQGKAVGSTMPNINSAIVGSLELPLPPLSIQRKVAAILFAYDHLIENNNRRIKLLEEMAQCIYREWFVDFRFPGHENRPLVDSELGPIPQGWAVTRLANVSLRVLDGDWIETKDQGGDAYRLLQVSNIGLGSFRETGNYRYISNDTFTRLRCTEIKVGTILVSRMPDPVGRAWYVDHLNEPAVTAVDVAIIEPDPEAIDPRYCAFYLNTPRNLQYAAQRASGTTRLRITRRDLATFPIAVPPLSVRKAFGAILDQNGELALALTLANNNLRESRDLLLPRLISGEVDVSDLDIAMAEDAA